MNDFLGILNSLGFKVETNLDRLKVTLSDVEKRDYNTDIQSADLRYTVEAEKLMGLHISGQNFLEEDWQVIENGIKEAIDLQVLYLSGTPVQSIDLSKTEKFTFLLANDNIDLKSIRIDIESSLLEEVRISNCSSLVECTLNGVFQNFKIIEVNNNALTSLDLDAEMPLLRYLNCSRNEISNLKLPVAPLLAYLYAETNVIEEISFEYFTNIELVELSNNALRKVDFPDSLKNLTSLSIENNVLEALTLNGSYPFLNSIKAANNRIESIQLVGDFNQLEFLDLSHNLLSKIEGLTSSQLQKMKALSLKNNSIVELPEEALGNVKAILGHLLNLESSIGLVPNKYLKVNIIGEGRIGKTQLFRFLNKENYVHGDLESHGTSSISYTVSKGICHAQLWDFGGQSYHHGFHQVFIRPNDFNIVLWSNKDAVNSNYSYWLGTARNYSSEGPLMLVQNVWTDTDHEEDMNNFTPHLVAYPDSEKLRTYGVGLDSTFIINVKSMHSKDPLWKNKHDYFLNTFHQAMVEYVNKIKTFKSISQRWIDIKEKLDGEPVNGSLHKKKDDFQQKHAADLDKASFETLLYYLEFTGSILYFSDNWALCGYVFINPPNLSDWIYKEILSKEFKDNSNGILDFKQLINRIGEEKAWVFREIIESFNLVFEEKGNEDHLVIPQFLPEQNNSFKKYLLDLLPSSLCLRFADFISEGRIFQFISEYGEYALDKSSYWRYGIIFTKDDVKALVHYHSTSRTLFVHLEEKRGRLEIAQEIFDFLY
jgi:Leucine-rich repeat (LRR) protein